MPFFLLFATDPIALWSLVAGVVGAVAAIIGAIAAIYAAKYAKASPTKGNTAHLEDVRTGIVNMNARLKKQEEAEGLQLRASRVSITATGNYSGNGSYPLGLSIREPKEQNLLITHVELYNEHGNSFGSFPCSKTDNPSTLDFHAAIPMNRMMVWFQGGIPVEMMNRMRLKLRVWMSIGEIAVSRDMAVTVIQTMGGGPPALILNGSV
jgi:hypothetical protein